MDLLRVLVHLGWTHVRQTGSHVVLKHPIGCRRVVVPAHRGAIQLYIESLVADGLPVPGESAPAQVLTISVAA